MTILRMSMVGPPTVLVLLLSACGTPTNTYTIDAPAAHPGFGRVVLLRGELPPDFSEPLRRSFESRLSKQLARRGGPMVVPAEEVDESTLTIQYRSPRFDSGSAAGRLGTAAGRLGTAAVGAFLPVSLLGEAGSGDIGLEATFLDGRGVVLGRVLVQRPVTGALASSGGSLASIADELAKYTQKFYRDSWGSAAAASMALSESESEPRSLRPPGLALFEPLVGTWDEEVEFVVPGKQPVRSTRRTTISWEGGGGVLVQRSEVLDNGAAGSYIVVIAMETQTGTLRSYYFDAERGAVESGPLVVTPVAGGFQLRHEDRDRTARTVVTFRDGGATRETVVTYWTRDRSRQISSARVRSRRVTEAAAAE